MVYNFDIFFYNIKKENGMALKNDILELLQNQKGIFLSGEEIAKHFSVSRAAVWKSIQSLKKENFPIAAVPNKGYLLERETDVINENGIKKLLDEPLSELKIEVIKSTDSTNEYLKMPRILKNGQEQVVIAQMQSQAKGRLGRSFFCSSETGLYMSLLLRPKFPLSDVVLITPAAAVAVASAIEQICGKHCDIKWVNDVYLEGKKICGILTEASLLLENTGVDYVILGIGVNVYPPQSGFPPQLKEIAGSIFSLPQYQNQFRNRLAAEIINRFFEYYQHLPQKAFFDEYRNRSMVLGKKINVIKNGLPLPATALEIENDFRLKVRYDNGNIESLSGEEISIRLS